jgi:hypothetical protein
MDDIPVVGQRPTAGMQAKGGAIVTIITPCTSASPCS